MSEKTNEISTTPNPVYAAAADGQGTAGLKDFLFKYLRYLPWIVISAIVFVVLAYLKIRYTAPIYHVQSSLLVKADDNGRGASGKDARFDDLFLNRGSINLNNEINILQSRPVLKRVARDLGLDKVYYVKGSIRSTLQYSSPPFELVVQELLDSSVGFTFQATIVNDNQFQLNEGTKPIPFGTPFRINGNTCTLIRNKNVGFNPAQKIYVVSRVPMAQAADNLLGSIKISGGNDQSTVLTLSYEGVNTDLGEDVLNTLMAVYDSINVEDKNRIAYITLKFIDDRLNSLSNELGGTQRNLRDFMVNNQAYDIQQQSKTYLDNLSTGAKERADQQIRMSIVNWLLDYIQNSKNQYTVVPTGLGIEEPALLQLISEYNRIQLEREANLKTTTSNNSLIVNLNTQLEKVRSSIYQALLNVKQAYTIAGKNLEQQEDVLKGHLKSAPGKSMQLLDITRQQKILEDLYSFLLQKKLETSISSASTISNSKVIEPAIASKLPIEPNSRKLYITYLIMGLMLPVGIIALIELLRDKVRGRADVEKYTHAPILGEIGHSRNDQTLVVTTNNRHFIGEQFRIVRTNLQYIIAKKERPVIMVTSSFSGEGKSFISTNMAAAIALTGKKTVIMEFDIRKPKIVSGLDLKRKMGITNYIIGRSSFDEMLVKVEGVENLFVIPCGPIPPNPAEILLDPLLDKLMQEVKERFDVVIMDTAPVGLVSDAMSLGKYADCTLYIIRQGHTYRRQLNMIEDLYLDNKLPRLSLLVNDVSADGGYYGGYGYGYYGSYSYGMDSGYFEKDSDRYGNFITRFFRNIRKRWFG